MTTSIDHGENVTVVGVDGSVSARNAVRWAAADAAGRGTTLLLVYADIDRDIARSGTVNPVRGTASGARARSALAAARAIALSILGDDAGVSTALDPGRPSEVLTGYADTARMLVLASRRKGTVARAVLGSVSTDVASHARCPIAVVPQSFVRTPVSDTAPTVVGVDGSPNDDAVLDVAFDQASRRGVPLRAVHAYESPQPRGTATKHTAPGARVNDETGPKRWIDNLVASWAEKYPDVEVTTHVGEDRPSHALLEEASHAQLIVVGARSRGSVAPLFAGSTSRAVLHRADIPVIIVPARDSRRP